MQIGVFKEYMFDNSTVSPFSISLQLLSIFECHSVPWRKTVDPHSKMNTESPSGEYSKDFELLSPPEDSISALSWSPAANFLAASSCDTLVHIYDVTKSTTGMLETAFGLDGTVLSCDWSQVMLALTESPFRHMLRTEYPQDGRVVAVAGADPKVKLFDLHAEEVAAENYRQPSTHPISTILQRHRSNSYACHRLRDKTVKFWDLGSRKCAGSLPCHDKVYSIDLKNKLLVIATAEKRVYTVDLNRFTQFFTTTNGPLKAQTRVVSCFPDASGYGIGSIEGKYAFSYVDPYRRRFVARLLEYHPLTSHPVKLLFSNATAPLQSITQSRFTLSTLYLSTQFTAVVAQQVLTEPSISGTRKTILDPGHCHQLAHQFQLLTLIETAQSLPMLLAIDWSKDTNTTHRNTRTK